MFVKMTTGYTRDGEELPPNFTITCNLAPYNKQFWELFHKLLKVWKTRKK
jgi:hypothetical protein